jgi:prefoldin subunit 5
MLWYRRIRESKENLESHIENINSMIERYNLNASQFKQQFPQMETSKHYNHL